MFAVGDLDDPGAVHRVFAYLFIDRDEMATRNLDHMKAHRARFAAIQQKALAA